MSEERLEKLGIPRRSFLKRLGAAAFIAPVVVSFGLDGIAEADTSFPNQCLPNQVFPNQCFPNQVQNNNNQGQNNNNQGQDGQ
jgi:hypothetical protein